ncbi:hypothetical protein FoTM2_013952 [Fusarium oxysporum f. sp. vasinfectum]|nr:hypothetical protein FoTM2_013952 [Fusarium oxysporum f. sp. vasinfectum]
MFFTIILCFLAATGTAHIVPEILGYRTIWSDSFDGSAGSLPDTSKWNIQQWYKELNSDYQEYKASPNNVHVTGDGFLRIIPRRDLSAERGWTSGRIESTYTFTPTPATKTIIQSSIRLGDGNLDKKQGIWPAFWLLGDSHRTGGPFWPECGELDIMEHAPGGICKEKEGISASVHLPDAGTDWHTYKVVIDRTPRRWEDETIDFWVDDQLIQQVKGKRIGNPDVWKSIARNKMFMIFNVAVGGDWPQPPQLDTIDGLGAGMEVGYVAHYVKEISEEDTRFRIEHYYDKDEDLQALYPDPHPPENPDKYYVPPPPDYPKTHGYPMDSYNYPPNASHTMLRILVAKKPLNRKVQASEIPGKDAEKSVRALEDFEIEQDQSFEDWIEIIDHAAPKTRAVVMNANKAVNQDYVVITKNTDL